MSDFWTDKRVEEFARIYCGNPTEGFNAEDFRGLKMEEKMRLFKKQYERKHKFVLLGLLADNFSTATNKGDLVEMNFYHAKMGRIMSEMREDHPNLMPKGEPFNPLEVTTTQDLRDELQQRGYAVGGGCLWMSDDVRPHDPSDSLTEDERMEIMEEVLTSDWLMEQINSIIEDKVRDYKNQDQ
jgi:hypothetical protein